MATSAMQVTASSLGEKVQPVLEVQVARLQARAKEIDALADRLHILADRTVGSPERGENAANGAPTPSPTHSVGRMNDAHLWIECAIGKLAFAVERLEVL